MTRSRILAAALSAVLVSGCMTVGPDYQRPAVEVPAQWPVDGAADPVSSTWWKAYEDPVLDRMVEEALSHNSDLQLAIARVDEARAALGISRADQYPGVTAGAGASRNRASRESATGVPPGTDPDYSSYRATLNAAYEIDFWGKYRRATEAARADLLAAQANRETVRLALATDVARGHFNLRALDAQIEITRRTITTRESSTALQRLRFEAGVSSELELRQVEAQAAQARALTPTLETLRAQQETALAVLLGRSPRDIAGRPVDRGSAIEALAIPPAVPAGLPSDLLERRPDVRQAEQSLIAANARIGQAKATYYPAISLTAFFGGESASLADLFSAQARAWQVSASAAQTIFDADRTGARVEQARARERQLLYAYVSALQNAFKDTLDALVAQRRARESLDAERERIAALEKSYGLVQLRYDNGVSSLLDVLDVERGLLDAQLNLVEAQRAQLAATADLFKALGGGWDGVLEVERSARAN
jgi:outer membrane protein, multidrug efflux system